MLVNNRDSNSFTPNRSSFLLTDYSGATQDLGTDSFADMNEEEDVFAFPTD